MKRTDTFLFTLNNRLNKNNWYKYACKYFHNIKILERELERDREIKIWFLIY